MAIQHHRNCNGGELSYELIRSLPKTDLHVHLDGSLRLETILDLADKYNIRLPADNIGDLQSAICVDDNCQNLEEYLKAFDITLKVLQTDEALERTAFELAEDAANENIRYMEVRFAPILHTNNHLPLERIISSVVDGLKRAEKIYNIKTGLIVCGMRNFNPDISFMSKRLWDRLSMFNEQELAVLLAVETAKVTVELSRKEPKIVGFDLAGPEDGFPARDFYNAFQEIIGGHLSITVHAGEGYGPESIEQAVKYCHAHRIGHGVRLIESHTEQARSLYQYFKDKRIPLEICVTSNVQTNSVPSLEQHPLRQFYNDRLRLTICTDNRLVSNITLSDEYCKIVNQFGFDKPDIERLIVYGFESTFLPYNEKEALMAEVIPHIKKLLYGTKPDLTLPEALTTY